MNDRSHIVTAYTQNCLHISETMCVIAENQLKVTYLEIRIAKCNKWQDLKAPATCSPILNTSSLPVLRHSCLVWGISFIYNATQGGLHKKDRLCCIYSCHKRFFLRINEQWVAQTSTHLDVLKTFKRSACQIWDLIDEYPSLCLSDHMSANQRRQMREKLRQSRQVLCCYSFELRQSHRNPRIHLVNADKVLSERNLLTAKKRDRFALKHRTEKLWLFWILTAFSRYAQQ